MCNRFALLAFTTLAAPGFAFAQSAEPAAVDDIVVTASTRAQSVAEAPAFSSSSSPTRRPSRFRRPKKEPLGVRGARCVRGLRLSEETVEFGRRISTGPAPSTAATPW